LACITTTDAAPPFALSKGGNLERLRHEMFSLQHLQVHAS
jgi:hypothetical protein